MSFELPTTQVLYSCNGCGARDRIVNVVERRKDEKLDRWMLALGITISADHRRFAPTCMTTTMAQVKIPAPAGRPLGGHR